MLGFARSLWLMFASRILDGLLGGNVALAQAYITDVTDEKARAKSLGIIGAAFGIGFVVGPAAGGFLSRWGVAVPAFAAAGLALVNFVWVLAALPESLTPERRAELAVNPRPPVTAAALLARAAPAGGRAAAHEPAVLRARVRHLPVLVRAVGGARGCAWRCSRPRTCSPTSACCPCWSRAWPSGPSRGGFSERTLIVAGLPSSVHRSSPGRSCRTSRSCSWSSRPWRCPAGVLNVALTSSLTKAVARDDVGGTLGLAASLQALTGIAAPAIGGLLLQQVGGWSLGALGALILAGLAVFAARTIRAPAAVIAPVGSR